MEEGRELLKTVIEATGLPPEIIEKELIQLLEARGLNPDHVTLDQLRGAMAIYLQKVILEAKKASC